MNPPTDLGPLIRATRSALTGEIPLPSFERPAVRPALEPIFARMVEEWGCPLVGVEWTGRRPVEGRIVTAGIGPALVVVS